MEECFQEGGAKIIKDDTTFFNPAQKLNRDISLEIIKSYFSGKEKIRILTAMEATGLRGIRYIKEISNSVLYLNDICPRAIETIEKNLIYNDLNQFSKFSEDCNLRTSTDKINIIKSDCQVLMNRYHGFFDVIDIDPFGSCSEFINSALKSIKHNGLIFFTCTDKAALCTNESKCFVKYNTTIKKLYCKNETPIRTLLSYISKECAKYDTHIVPILSLSVDFYIRVVVKIVKNRPKSCLKDNSYVAICDCYNMVEVPLNGPFVSICNLCTKPIKTYGTFWNKGLYDYDFINKLLDGILESGNERMVGILRLMSQEIPNLFYYEMDKIASIYKVNCIKLRSIMNGLANAGYNVSLTHFDNNSFKTNAKLEDVIKIIRVFPESLNGVSFERNSIVDKIFERDYHKGLIASKLKPLSLPKK